MFGSIFYAVINSFSWKKYNRPQKLIETNTKRYIGEYIKLKNIHSSDEVVKDDVNAIVVDASSLEEVYPPPPVSGYADKSQKQTCFLEYRDAYKDDIGREHRPRYSAQQSETRLEPAGTTASEMVSKSEYPTIGAFSHIERLLLEVKTKFACLKAVLNEY